MNPVRLTVKGYVVAVKPPVTYGNSGKTKIEALIFFPDTNSIYDQFAEGQTVPIGKSASGGIYLEHGEKYPNEMVVSSINQQVQDALPQVPAGCWIELYLEVKGSKSQKEIVNEFGQTQMKTSFFTNVQLNGFKFGEDAYGMVPGAPQQLEDGEGRSDYSW